MYIRKNWKSRASKAEFTKLRIGFRSKNQIPVLMIWREYWCSGEVVGGEVLFSVG